MNPEIRAQVGEIDLKKVAKVFEDERIQKKYREAYSENVKKVYEDTINELASEYKSNSMIQGLFNKDDLKEVLNKTIVRYVGFNGFNLLTFMALPKYFGSAFK